MLNDDNPLELVPQRETHHFQDVRLCLGTRFVRAAHGNACMRSLAATPLQHETSLTRWFTICMIPAVLSNQAHCSSTHRRCPR